LLERHDDNAKLLNAGRILITTLNMRLSQPDTLIEITGLTQLAGIRTENDVVPIGALAKHREIAGHH
jgi:CO/xanthine dehydrogenase FAD-binding subunit